MNIMNIKIVFKQNFDEVYQFQFVSIKCLADHKIHRSPLYVIICSPRQQTNLKTHFTYQKTHFYKNGTFSVKPSWENTLHASKNTFFQLKSVVFETSVVRV